MNLFDITVKNSYWMLSLIIVKLSTQIILLSVFARELTIEEFGIATIAISIFNISWAFFKTGLENAIIQRPHLLDEKERSLLTASWIIAFTISITAPVFIWYIAIISSDFYNMPILKDILVTFAPVVSLRALSIVPEAVIKKKLKLKQSVLVEVISLLVGLVLFSIYLTFSGYGYWAWPLGIAGYNVIAALLFLFLGFTLFKPHFSLKAIREMSYYSFGFSLSTGINTLTVEIDKLIIQSTLGTIATSTYARATQIYLLPASILGQIVEGALFPSLAHTNAEASKLKKSILLGSYLLSVTVLPASVILFILSEEVVILLLSSKWLAVVTPLKVLCIGMYFRSALKVYEAVIRSLDVVYLRAGFYLANLFIVSLSLLYLSKFGMVGISFALVFSSLVFYTIMTLFILKKVNISFFEILKIQSCGFYISFLLLSLGNFFYYLLTFFAFPLPLVILFNLAFDLLLIITSFYIFAWEKTPDTFKTYISKKVPFLD